MTLVHAETGEVVAPLSDDETALLDECQTVIERGLASFIEVGDALLAIRDQRLYRSGYATFEHYCQERWGLTHRHANRLIEASEVVEALGPIGPKPANEGQARALAPLKAEPERMAEAMAKASEATDGKPTAKAIEAEVERMLGREMERRAQRKKDAEEQAEFVKAHTPEGFDPVANAELTRQRGAFRRLCADLVGLGDPAEFVANQTPYLEQLIAGHHRPEAAYVWLDTYLKVMEDHL